MDEELDFNARYTVKDWPGIAVRIYGYPKVWEPLMCLCTDGDGHEWEAPDEYEGEWMDDVDCGRVVVVMVGDDCKHTVDVDDLTPLGEDDYCHVCGQVGCSHDGIDRG